MAIAEKKKIKNNIKNGIWCHDKFKDNNFKLML